MNPWQVLIGDVFIFAAGIVLGRHLAAVGAPAPAERPK